MKVAVIKFIDVPGQAGPLRVHEVNATYLLVNIHPLDPHKVNHANIWEGTCIWDCQDQKPTHFDMAFGIQFLQFQFEADEQFISEYVAELL